MVSKGIINITNKIYTKGNRIGAIIIRADAVIKQEGMNVLIEKLGQVDAERFISLIIREFFDYTKWQVNLFEELT